MKEKQGSIGLSYSILRELQHSKLDTEAQTGKMNMGKFLKALLMFYETSKDGSDIYGIIEQIR